MSRQRIGLLGVPIDLGGNHRGVDMGPTALRVAGLQGGLERLGYEVRDLGDIPIPNMETLEVGDPQARFLAEIARVSENLARRVLSELERDRSVVVLGGDHSAALGSVTGTALHHRRRGEDIGLVWVDAHTDMNTPSTSPSGNIHGMPLACLLGHGPQDLVDVVETGPKLDPSKVVLVGIRSVDPAERELVKASGVTVFTMRDVDELGVHEVMRRAVRIAGEATAGFHLSYDVDAVDASVAPGVGTPVPGGLTYREAHLIAELAADSGRLLAMDVMEVNPVADVRNATAELGVGLVLSAFGQRIL